MESATAKRNASCKRWTKEESQRLLEFYPERGADWDGWRELLPNKTEKAIRGRALRMGLSRGKKPQQKKKVEYAAESEVNINQPDPYEDVVIAYMSAGFPPSEIDGRMKWFKGSASLILANMWKREGD